MPKKSNKKTVPEADEANTQSQGQTQAQVQAEPKKRTRKPKEPVVEASASTGATSTSASDSAVPKTRHVPTRESVEKEFDELTAKIDEEINKLRSSSAKSKGVKFLRTLGKSVKILRNHALRVSKQRPTNRRNNTNSGFLKPVQISKDLAKFTGWDHSQLRSRVDVTKYICDYIKQNNLQDPEDKRNIRVDQDSKLKKLLNYDNKDGKPLTYYSLQTYLKSHFTPSPVVAPEVATPAPVQATPTPAKTAGKAEPKKGK
jgi:upstream activation factor subunit UAF30